MIIPDILFIFFPRAHSMFQDRNICIIIVCIELCITDVFKMYQQPVRQKEMIVQGHGERGKGHF